MASPCLGVDSSYSQTLLGEVSSQSSIVNLLHVLMDFGFGVFQQVSLTLREEIRSHCMQHFHDLIIQICFKIAILPTSEKYYNILHFD